MAAKDRSQLHLCLTDYGNMHRTWTVHHIDVALLFLLRSDDPDPPEAMEAEHLVLLPPPATRFETRPETNVIEFHLLGDNLLVSTDRLGRTLIYDAGKGAVSCGPTMHDRKSYTVSVTVGDRSLYVLNSLPGGSGCFEVLLYDPDPLRDDWFWHALPRPPYATGRHGHRVTAHAVVGGNAIWTSAEGAGTFSFHTERRAWRQEGAWELPFRGNAEYIQSCNLWFGLSPYMPMGDVDDGPLVAADLSVATASRPPEVCAVLEVEDEFTPPRGWVRKPVKSCVVHLGSGKLCVVRFFATDPSDKRRNRGPVAVVTAVEVRPPHDGGGGRVQMVKRASRCIKLGDLNTGINWVL